MFNSLFDLVPPIKEPKKEKPVADPAQGAKGETALRVGSLVKTKLPKRGPFLDRAEQQLLDEELQYICGKEQVGKVVRVAPHSIVIDFVLSAADYKHIYPGPQLLPAKKSDEPHVGSLSIDMGSALSLDRGGQSQKKTQIFEGSHNSSNQSPLGVPSPNGGSGSNGSNKPPSSSSDQSLFRGVTSNSTNLGFIPVGDVQFSSQSDKSKSSASASGSTQSQSTAGAGGGDGHLEAGGGAAGGETATPINKISTGTFRESTSASESGSPKSLGSTALSRREEVSHGSGSSSAAEGQSVLVPQQQQEGGRAGGDFATDALTNVPTLTVTGLGGSSTASESSPLVDKNSSSTNTEQQQHEVVIGEDGRPVRRVTTLPPNEMAESINSNKPPVSTTNGAAANGRTDPTASSATTTISASAAATNSTSPGSHSLAAVANNATTTTGDDAEEMIFLRKTLPINYASLVVTSLDSNRQNLIRSKFSDGEFEVANQMASAWIDEILSYEALDMTDVAFHYQRLAGEEEYSASNSNNVNVAPTGPPGSPGLDTQGLRVTTMDGSSSNRPVWVSEMPSALVHFEGLGSTLASYFRSLRRRVTRHLLSWLYICCGMAKLQLGHGSTDPKSVISCGRRATLLDPYNARAYSILISTFHCTSQLDLSMQTINQCRADCPQPNRDQCEWLNSLMLLDTVYRLYNPKLKPIGQRLRTSLEVTIPNVTEKPHHLGLSALQRFAPGEAIMTEAPAIWIPFPSNAVAGGVTGGSGSAGGASAGSNHLTVPGSTHRRKSTLTQENPLSDGSASGSGPESSSNNPAADEDDDGGGGMMGGLFTILAPAGSGGRQGESTSLYQGGRSMGGLMSVTNHHSQSATSVSAFSISSNGSESTLPQCAHCGFILIDKSSISKTLKQNNFADIGCLFDKRYPARNRIPCRHGDPIPADGEDPKISDSIGSKCKLVYCSAICEEKAWNSWHKVNCLENGLLTKSHQQSLKLACGAFGNTTDSGVHLFLRVSMMAFCHVEKRLIDQGLDHNSPNINKRITEELNLFFESIPIVTKLNKAPGYQPIPAMNTIIHVLSCLSARHSKIALVYEPEFADRVLQTCILSHRVVTRCPVTSVLKAKPRQPNWSTDVAPSFEVKMLCLFPVLGCALSPEQRLHAAGPSGRKGDKKGMSVGDRSESLFSIASSDGFDDLQSEASDEGLNNKNGGDGEQQEAQEDEVPNVIIESQPGDLGRGLFCLRCPEDSKGIDPKTEILPPLVS